MLLSEEKPGVFLAGTHEHRYLLSQVFCRLTVILVVRITHQGKDFLPLGLTRHFF